MPRISPPKLNIKEANHHLGESRLTRLELEMETKRAIVDLHKSEALRLCRTTTTIEDVVELTKHPDPYVSAKLHNELLLRQFSNNGELENVEVQWV